MGGATATVDKPSFTLEQLRRKRGRYEEVNGTICKWCGDCKAFVPVDRFEYVPSFGRHTAFCCTHETQRAARAASPEGQAETAYWTEVNQRRKAKLATGHTPTPRKHSRHELVNGVVHKTCTACSQLLPLDQFKKHGQHLRSQCRACCAPKQSQYGQSRKAETRRWSKQRYATNLQHRLSINLRGHIQKALRGTVKKSDRTLELLGCSLAQFKQHLEALFQPGMTWENWGIHRQEGPRRWHVDHIRPIASFDLADPEQQRKCFHWSNMQPMWAVDNIRKGTKLDWEVSHA